MLIQMAGMAQNHTCDFEYNFITRSRHVDEALKTFMQAFQIVSIMPDTFQSLGGVLTRRRDSSFSRRA